MTSRTAWLACLAGLASACATGISLTPRGSIVQNVAPTDVPVGCDVLGDVPIGIPPDAARPHSEEQLTILMRNKAGEMGGNYVMIESSDHRSGPDGVVYYFGRGRAYRCTDDQINASSSHPPAEHPEEPEHQTPPADDEVPH